MTGSSGLLGRAVIATKRRYEFIGHDTRLADDPIPGAEYLVGDLRDSLGLLEAVRSRVLSFGVLVVFACDTTFSIAMPTNTPTVPPTSISAARARLTLK